MSFRTQILAQIERIRGQVPGSLDLRPHTVTVRVRTWSGARAGLGTKTDVDTVLTNAGYNVKVKEVTSRDVIASGGRYEAGDFRIGPMTPGSNAVLAENPQTTTTGREVFFRIEGPGFPTGGAWFKRIDGDETANFRTDVVVRALAVTP